jgi:signal transduction histidine kinase
MQLRQAQKMESLGTLAAGIAHDFNNIIFPISGYTELIMETTVDHNRAGHYLSQIMSATNRAKMLVSQIISISRQNEGAFVPIKVDPVIEEVIKFIRSCIPTNIEIRKKITPSSKAIMGSSTQIHQVIMNLTTNAYQSMAEQGGTIEVFLDEIEIV